VYKLIHLISLYGATDVSDPDNGAHGRTWGGKTLEELKDAATLAANGITPVRKRLVVNLADRGYVHDKPEGLTIVDAHTIAVSNDDDFGIAPDGNGGMKAKLVPTADGRTFVDGNVLCFIHLDEDLVVDANTAVTAQLSNWLPERSALEAAYPNPFNSTTVLTYALTGTGPVELSVYNSLGQQVASLVSQVQTPGRYRVAFEAGSLASGVYLAQLRTGQHTYVRRMALVR
jgi:hypothetical protein